MTSQTPTLEPKGILIFGAGNVGQTVARIAAGYGWPVTAVNRTGDKVGRDLGALTGCSALTGSTVGDAEIIDVADVWADIAVVAINDRLEHNLPYHRRLLQAGLNVICVGAESSYPKDVSPQIAAELNSIALDNGVTFTGCGLWDTYRIWSLKTLTGPCSALRGLHHRSVTDADRFGPEVVKLAHIGEDPDTLDTEGASARSIYRVFVVQVVESLGLTIDHVAEHQEPVILDEGVYCAALQQNIEAGKCVGLRTVISVHTREDVIARAEIDLRLTADAEDEWMSWSVDGDPPVAVRISGLDTGHATASSTVHRIPDVLAASPGLLTVDQLPPMQPPKPFVRVTA